MKDEQTEGMMYPRRKREEKRDSDGNILPQRRWGRERRRRYGVGIKHLVAHQSARLSQASSSKERHQLLPDATSNVS